ncbi:MAG: M28 family metallopeptidase [Kiritimatiellia bacterium]
MRRSQAVFAAVAASLILAGCRAEVEARGGSWDRLPPEAGIRMFAYTSEFVKIAPRDSGTLGAAKASKWLAQEIRRMGLKPRADTWTENTPFGPKTFCNIYVDIPGETPAVVLFGSHYDTKAGIGDGFQGANDGGSSTGVLLALAEHLAERRPKLRHTVRFAFFDGEECFGDTYRDNDGLHGSRRMAEQFDCDRARTPLVAAIILDMVGDEHHKLETPRNVTPWLAKIALEEGGSRPEVANVSLASTIIIDDHLPFLLARFSAIDLIDFEYGSAPGLHDYWHTMEDTIDKISPDSLYKTGALALAMLARIEAGDGVPAELQPRPAAENGSR